MIIVLLSSTLASVAAFTTTATAINLTACGSSPADWALASACKYTTSALAAFSTDTPNVAPTATAAAAIIRNRIPDCIDGAELACSDCSAM